MFIFPRPVFHALLPSIAALALLTAMPAGAQTLILGTYNAPNPGLSGTATIGVVGTTVSGTFKFLIGADPTTIAYKTVTLNNASSLTLQDGGTISNALSAFNTSTANIDGGSIANVKCYDSSVTSVYGGSVFSLAALGSSSLSGPSGSGTINVYGGSLSSLTAQNGGVIDLFGTGLTETFVASSSSFQIYDVSGILEKGTPFSVKYSSNGGTLLFDGQRAVPGAAPVPEASTTVSFGLLLALGLGSMIAAARKKRMIV